MLHAGTAASCCASQQTKIAAKNSAEMFQEEVPATPRSLGLPEFLSMLGPGDDARQRVAALQSVNRSIFETENEAKMLFRKVIATLNDPVWDVQRAAIQLLSELSPRFDFDTVHSLNRLLFHLDPKVQMMIACVLKHVDDADGYCHEILRDRLTAEAAVSHQGRLLEFLDAPLKADREIVLAAVKQDGESLKYAQQHLQGDDEIVLAAVAESGRAVQFASREIIARHAGLRALHDGRGLCLCGDYLVLEELGQGAYGEVTKAEHVSTKCVVAMKTVLYDPEVWVDGIPAQAVRELSLLRKLTHPNVVRLLDANVDSSDAQIQMVFEFHPTDLRKVLTLCQQRSQCLPIEQVRHFSANLLNGLFACHSRNILHRDLKPENLLISTEGVLKIADFGLARMQNSSLTRLTLEVVTLWYRSPELLLGTTAYGFEVDCWSSGCVISEMCTGRPLFPGESEVRTLLKIFQLLGTPSQTNWPNGTQLYLFNESFPTWPVTGLKHIFEARPELYAHQGDELLSGLLRLQPDQRLSSRQARCHHFCRHM